ncbi:hypothetical protein BpHYR1_026398 [Brachionus plicatilis]|uniref:Uncharacterized protein n=1 Tax=Brachionus plicatilis TaxID=10195 RepID=A0A3M7R4U6_BRAPC|nr:hypothetical protein BpHYR1_026398 [Brachionus plicatilis]
MRCVSDRNAVTNDFQRVVYNYVLGHEENGAYMKSLKTHVKLFVTFRILIVPDYLNKMNKFE